MTPVSGGWFPMVCDALHRSEGLCPSLFHLFQVVLPRLR